MFSKLQLRLTLINAGIILALFVLLITGTYGFFRIESARRIEEMAQRIATDVSSGFEMRPLIERGGPPPGPPRPGDRGHEPPPMPDFFFVKTGPDGMVVEAVGRMPEGVSVEGLARLAVPLAETKGFVTYEGTDYYYYKSAMATAAGLVVVFHDMGQETRIIQILLTALTAVGVVCALLTVGASYYLARRSLVPIEAAWRQQKEFLSDASHEFRTPLTVIRANLDVVMDSPEETVASQQQWLSNINEELGQMTGLVESLLFLARADSERQLLEKKPFSVSEAVGRAVASFNPVAHSKGIFLVTDIAPSVTATGDEAHIRRALGILLDNALRHTEAGGEVRVRLAESSHGIEISVADNGEGIAAEHLAKIFDRFYQVDKARAKGGAGLGLAIAKWIVESHGGQITAESVPGQGTTFRLDMPWRQTMGG